MLAVGDAEFQKKCLGKMGEVAKGGRTVLFVSHNMPSVTRLCTRTIWIQGGSVCLDDKTEHVVSEYLTAGVNTEGECVWMNGTALSGITEFKLKSVSIRTEDDHVNSSLDIRKPFWVELNYEIEEELSFCRVGFNVITSDGFTVFAAYDTDDEKYAKRRIPGTFKSRCQIPGNLLSPGRYTVSVAAGVTGIKTLVHEERVVGFDIIDTGAVGSSITTVRNGIIRPRLIWEQEKINVR